MSTDKTLQIESTSSAETEAVAEKIAKRLKGGELIELASDLGGGKTTFVHGLARGIGSDDKVSSPTFTISKIYKADKLELHHFDFYRLSSAGLAAYELHDVINDPGIVVVVEWSGVVEHVLPEDRLSIVIAKTGEEARQLSINYPDTLSYLIEDLC
jgi:tRNA threonylcarbamoyladenosine biosynthesis protein TsaE